MNTVEAMHRSNMPARIASWIFNPLLMPVYGLLVLFSFPVAGYIPFELKKLLLFIMLVNNVMLPVTLFSFLKYRNLFSSWPGATRYERSVKLFFVTVLYATTSYIIFRFPLPAFLKTYIFSVSFLSLAISLIHFFSIISVHSAAAGALTALVIVLSARMHAVTIWHLLPVVIISGIILSSRLSLGYRSPGQVWAGYFSGLVLSGLYMWMF